MLSSTGAWSRTTYIAHGSSPLMKVNVTHLQQNNGWHHLILSVFGHFQVFRLSSRRSGPAYHAAPHTKRWRRFHRFVIKPVPPGDKTTPGHNLTCCCWWTEPKPTLLTLSDPQELALTHVQQNRSRLWPRESMSESFCIVTHSITWQPRTTNFLEQRIFLKNNEAKTNPKLSKYFSTN